MTPSPILHFRGQTERTLHYAIVLVGTGPRAPEVRLGDDLVESSARMSLPDDLCWHRYDFSVPAERARHTYRVGEAPYHFWTPGPGDPLRLAHASCNGDARERRNRAPRAGRNRLWTQLAHVHASAPYHLMIHGGDQIYADRIWHVSRRRRRAHYREQPQGWLRHYVQRYLWLWRQPEIAAVLASIPALMTWDDHDIHDGWGSKPPRGSDAASAAWLFDAARTACALFQHGELPAQLPTVLHWRRRIGHTGLIGLDARSERTDSQVFSAHALGWLSAALSDLRDCAQLLIVSSTPFAGFNVQPVERALALCGLGLFSDLRDQWSSTAHRAQWLQVMNLLFEHAHTRGTRIGILSGEIHHGAHAVLRRGSQEILQYVSSGIAHRPMWLPLTRLLDRCTRAGWSHGGISVRPLSVDARGHTLLPSENWLSLELPAESLPRASWQSMHGANRAAHLGTGYERLRTSPAGT